MISLNSITSASHCHQCNVCITVNVYPAVNDALLQVVPLSSIVEYRASAGAESLRSLALSVYTQCRRLVTHSVLGRSLTGFGPAAASIDKMQHSAVSDQSLLSQSVYPVYV